MPEREKIEVKLKQGGVQEIWKDMFNQEHHELIEKSKKVSRKPKKRKTE